MPLSLIANLSGNSRPHYSDKPSIFAYPAWFTNYRGLSVKVRVVDEGYEYRLVCKHDHLHASAFSEKELGIGDLKALDQLCSDLEVDALRRMGWIWWMRKVTEDLGIKDGKATSDYSIWRGARNRTISLDRFGLVGCTASLVKEDPQQLKASSVRYMGPLFGKSGSVSWHERFHRYRSDLQAGWEHEIAVMGWSMFMSSFMYDLYLSQEDYVKGVRKVSWVANEFFFDQDQCKLINEIIKGVCGHGLMSREQMADGHPYQTEHLLEVLCSMHHAGLHCLPADSEFVFGMNIREHACASQKNFRLSILRPPGQMFW